MFMNQSCTNWGYQEELSSTARPIAIDNQQVSVRLVGCPAQLPLDALYDFVHTQKIKAEDVEKVIIRTDESGAAADDF